MYGFNRVDACKMSSRNKEDILQLVTGVTRARKTQERDWAKITQNARLIRDNLRSDVFFFFTASQYKGGRV